MCNNNQYTHIISRLSPNFFDSCAIKTDIAATERITLIILVFKLGTVNQHFHRVLRTGYYTILDDASICL